MAYYAESQKKYAKKTITFAVKYYPAEADKGQAVLETIKASGKSINEWIKEAIREKLERETAQTIDQNEN